ncbi:MAG: hypothetical protein KIT34_06935 [Cyanobacteria bacterium TGS_CYA1]|nr:hypothetical protein [Cyanobacteria bacterium TGS_CYA1]
MTSTKVPIDMDGLLFAWRDDSPDNIYYLDIETGDVNLVNRGLLDLKDLTNEIEINRERYLYLPKPSSDQMKSDLRDFMKTIDDKDKLKILEMAFESPHILAGFKKILSGWSGQTEALNEFLAGRTHLRVRQWLEANCLVVTDRKDELDLEDQTDFSPGA